MNLATLSLALLEGGFIRSSSSLAVIGFLLTSSSSGGSQVQINCSLGQWHFAE